jgi:short chain dehydrogenase
MISKVHVNSVKKKHKKCLGFQLRPHHSKLSIPRSKRLTSKTNTMALTTPQTWLITGCSTGLGASLALHALKPGHTILATARNPSSAPSYAQITSLGEKWLALDVNSPKAGDVVQEAVKLVGRINVLVNNAGYSILGAVEDISFVFPFST